MTLRDAVKTAVNGVGKQALLLSQTAANGALTTEQRVSAFRQIITLETGTTWLRRSKAIERDFGLSDVFLKFEGDNPTGTQKDRIAFAQVEDALRTGYGEVAVATCGNYGVAVALAAKLAGMKCHIFIPAGYHTDRLGEMEQLGGVIHRPAGSYEDVVRLSSQRAAAEGWYDANPGGRNTELQIAAYATIGEEIASELGRAPVCCAVPVSNGTLFAGIHRGLGNGDSTMMIAASSTAKNPIVYSFRKGFRECVDLDPAKIHETVINEPLINWHSFDGAEALKAIYASRGRAYNISDERMRKMTTYLAEREALRVLPASTAGLIALLRMHEEGILPDGQHVAVLTAKR
ncbi:pyridoxal-phosphate dependent enzyme [Neolewinella aurantiaca]|uniref:Pyridoxal-phosphate dependent enzyme n=1 Tax=Neolewinella aurantiaca TaxID=2602767 RepID=A0A5C7FKB4_9BACT|nr:pyridoxal-phosphate dependent enzyme [Neolewinella aurantiaca]TXF90321.1 pyridoxal-phosphate dependent enzyme [Neolewinella aurantiaca]